MQALLSFDQAPPFAAPARFFLTAPLFAILAGLLVLWSGPGLFASRWTPEALALTHLITVGFMLQVMLGAMLQILPVVAGANMAQPRRLATLVHLAITLGALFLAAGFLGVHPLAFRLAALFLGGGVALFVGSAGHALYGLPPSSATIRGLQISLLGLSVTVALGVLLTFALDGELDLPLLRVTSIHFSWGFVGWGLVLVAAVAFVVVPMFQMTPAYPAWFSHLFPWSALALLSLWSIAEAADWPAPSALLAGALVLMMATFAVLTLHLQRRSKRARFDATQHYWRVGMLCTLAACALGLLARGLPDNLSALAERQEWLCGVLLLYGGFMSVIIGMLYKIFPFLVWLHLQNLGGGRVLAPNMNKVIAGQQINRQMRAHFLALALLLAAAIWPEWFTYPAGIALLVANGGLLRNLLAAVAFYRQQRTKIAALTAAATSSDGKPAVTSRPATKAP